MIQVTSFKGSEVHKKKKIKNKGIIRANMAQGAVALPLSFLPIPVMIAMKKVSDLPKEDMIKIRKAASKGLTDSGLRDKGVKNIYVKQFNKVPKSIKGIVELFTNWTKTTSKEDKKVVNLLCDEIEAEDKKSILNKILKLKNHKNNSLSKEIKAFVALAQFKLGINAGYLPEMNKILIPNKSLTTSAFHEMGHAMNKNFSKIGRLLQKSRKFSLLAAPVIAGIAIMIKKKVSDPPSDKKIQRTKDFVKKNAGVLAFASFLPVIIEEGMATFKGNKLAKSLLDKKLLNKVKIANALGLVTYFMAAATVAVSTAVAVKVKDNIQAKYEEKLARKAAKIS